MGSSSPLIRTMADSVTVTTASQVAIAIGGSWQGSRERLLTYAPNVNTAGLKKHEIERYNNFKKYLEKKTLHNTMIQ